MTSMEGKPGKLMVGRKRKPDGLWHALREAQRKCGCNTKTLNVMRQAVQPFCKDEKKQAPRADRKFCNFANAVLLELHGCVRCHDFVFSPKDFALRCPKCGHPRFNRKKQPNEVFYYFPLKRQLEVMLRNSQYRHLLLHEARRRKKKGIIADVYDTPRWRKVAGPPTEHLSRIVFQICVDGFPWSSRKHGVGLNPNRQIFQILNIMCLNMCRDLSSRDRYACSACPRGCATKKNTCCA